MQRVTIGRLAMTAMALGLAACGGSVGSAGGGTAAPVAVTTPTTATSTPSPVPTVPPVKTAVPAAAAPPAAKAVVVAAMTARGNVLAAASDGRTVYTFNSDMSGSAVSNCTGGCASEWPALTVASGTMLSAGPGVNGHLGHIVRSDGRTQVTYNGLPLYFFAGDSGPGQTHGSYPGWSLARP